MKFSLRKQSDGLLYTLLERTTPWMLTNHFRRMHVHRHQTVPDNTPVLLAANHPTAFLDPVFIGRFVEPPIYNMTRGDIFRNPRVHRLLMSINMFPVYRPKDGYNEAERNDPVFEFCVGKMQQRRVVNLFVEGQHHADKRMLAVQKGIARIAFPAYERFQQADLQIIPVGVSYWTSDQPRDVGFLNVGDPIFIRDYSEEYQRQPAAAVRRLCLDIERTIRDLILHIHDRADDDLAERLLTLHRSEHSYVPFPVVRYGDGPFRAEKAVLEHLNTLTPERKTALRTATDTYFTALDRHRLTDEALCNPRHAGRLRLLLLLATAVFFVPGYLAHRPLEWLAARITNRKVGKREFKSSIYMGVEHYGGIIWHLLWIVVALFTGSPAWAALAFLLPFLGWFSLVYREVAGQWWAAWRANNHSAKAELLALRAAVQQAFS
jgi:1-acyl-sn-glycerol-3-phosphate acyltransferase